MARIALAIPLALALATPAGQAAGTEPRAYDATPASGCYLVAKEQIPGASWIKHRPAHIRWHSRDHATAIVWFPADRTDWLAACDVRYEGDGAYYQVLELTPYTGPLPTEPTIITP
ncbi:MAG: hypothetical protein U5L11_02645 [Arhodomonas sp.]|nr:hypothetical protein [Arhodomonas sp.]